MALQPNIVTEAIKMPVITIQTLGVKAMAGTRSFTISYAAEPTMPV